MALPPEFETIDTGAPTDTPTEVDLSGAGLDAETASLLAFVVALRGIDENLRKAYEEYLKPQRNMAEFRRLIKASVLFTNYDRTARGRKVLESEQPGVYKQQKDKYVTEQKKRIIAALGPKAWNADVQKQVETAFEFALDDDVLDKLIVEFGKLGTVTGAAGASIEELQQYANSFGVSELFDNKYWDSQRQAMFLGTTTAFDIQNDIKTRAAAAYPAWAEGINAGKSMDVQAGWLKSIVAKDLGIDPNTLSWDDPMIMPWLNWVDPKTNKQAIPPMYTVRTENRRKNFDAFARTPEGTSYLDGLTVKVLQDMGLI